MMENSGSGNNIGDDVVKLCPLCNAAVRYLSINLTEKVLMCVNVYCEYPFDEDLQFVPLDYKVNLDVGTSSLARSEQTNLTKSGSSSETSYSALSDIEKLNKVCESEENQKLNLDVAPKISTRKTKSNMHVINKKELKKNVQDLKHLTMELNKIDIDESDCIKNKKWLKNLMKMQGSSGVKLVKKEEMKLLKEITPAFDGGELKIDINTNKKNISSINVQIINKHGD